MTKTILSVFFILCLAFNGCEFGTFPLTVDGVPITVSYRVNTEATSFSGGPESVNLSDAYDIGDTFDSVKVYNITILIDDVDPATDVSTTITGSASVDGQTLFELNAVPISAFLTEKSIFNGNVPGMQFRRGGVRRIAAQLEAQGTVDRTVVIAASGTASRSPLKFTIHLKIYTQFKKNK